MINRPQTPTESVSVACSEEWPLFGVGQSGQSLTWLACPIYWGKSKTRSLFPKCEFVGYMFKHCIASVCTFPGAPVECQPSDVEGESLSLCVTAPQTPREYLLPSCLL